MPTLTYTSDRIEYHPIRGICVERLPRAGRHDFLGRGQLPAVRGAMIRGRASGLRAPATVSEQSTSLGDDRGSSVGRTERQGTRPMAVVPRNYEMLLIARDDLSGSAAII